MEKRQANREQFFQFNRDDELMPSPLPRCGRPDVVQGLLLDISEDGVQILTDKSNIMNGDSFLVIVHADDYPSVDFITATVRRLWSKADGARYMRNGFAYEGLRDLASFIANVLAAHDGGYNRLSCELVAI